MTITTLLYTIIAGIIALLLAFFQYKYNKKSMSKLNMLFLLLRFVTLFSVLLLIINPKFNSITFYKEKPNLILAVDNSSSVKHLKQDNNVQRFLKKIKENKELNTKFNISTYTFGSSLKPIDSITFSEQETNINNVFNQLSQVYKNVTAPMLLITDGNQTFGNDYQYTSSNYKHPIYPIILGDTVTRTDLSIQQLNVNKYAFLKNQFPVECIVVYNGNNSVNSRFEVRSGKNVVYSKTVSFSKKNNSKYINFLLPANRIGVGTYKAIITPISNETNIINNSKVFAVEVIDQKTNVAIVSDFPHPDIGALKKSIESNEQHSVTILKPKNFLSQKNNFQSVILYQPNQTFKSVIEYLKTDKKGVFIIIGTETDLQLLNSHTTYFSHEITNQTDDVQAELNKSYTPFIIKDINFESFPPLKSNFGEVSFTIPFETVLYQKINSKTSTKPLLSTFEVDGKRAAILFGKGIWKWRAQNFINHKSFVDFDNFINKIIQYLSINKPKKRLVIDYKSFYNGNNGITIKAEFFDKNYNFDNREELQITVKNPVSNTKQTFPFILKDNMYQVDLSSLKPSEYSFVVNATNENISQSGHFKILEYNVEQQFLNANVTKLRQVADNSLGKSYFIAQYELLITDLIRDNRYQTIQKSHKNTIPLIDWKYLLFLIVLSLTIEWFLRKYNGLI